MGNSAKALPDVRSVAADPNFQKLGEADQISVLSKVDPGFNALANGQNGQQVQREVLQQLLKQTPETRVRDLQEPISPAPGESFEQTMQRATARGKEIQHTPGALTQAEANVRAEGRQVIPQMAAAGASTLAGPEAGLSTRMLLSAGGGAIGSAGAQSIPPAGQPFRKPRCFHREARAKSCRMPQSKLPLN